MTVSHRPRTDFVRETQELLLRRTRIGIIVGACIMTAFMAVDALRVAPERFGHAVELRIAGTLVLLLLLPITRARHALRWAEWLGGATVLVLAATTAAIMPLFRGVGDPQYAIQGTGLVLVVLGASILLPFEGWKMLVLGLLCAAFHVVFTLDFPLQQNLPVLMATLSAVAIAVVGSHELTRSRRADFEGRRAKEALLRAREDFVAMVTHDIRNPLATVDGFVEMLRDHAGTTPDDREALLTGVQRAVRTAIALAGNFLDASKIEAGRFVVKTGATDVAELVARALANHRPHALHKGVALRNDTAADLPPVDADGAALDRVFANLIGNAIKHTPAGGTVSVAARHANGGIEIVVEDTGSGIPVGEEARIFERYTSAASRADSTGLGLFIVHTITAAHGGTIVAENRGDVQGARFRVVLPAAAARPA